MTDGANLNMRADVSMKAIIGGGEEPEQLTDLAFEARIRLAPLQDEFDYDGCSTYMARLILEAYEKYPVLQELPTESRYLTFADGSTDFSNFHSIDTTLYDVMRKLYDDDSVEYDKVFSVSTGFMWGWAVNAARNILELGPVLNPALMTISIKGE